MDHPFRLPTDTGVPSSSDLEHVRAMKQWTREILRLPDTAVVTVHEVPCADPGCPLLVTTLLVQTEQTQSWRFERPKAAITKLMLTQVLRPRTG